MTILLVSADFTWFRPSLSGLDRLGRDSQVSTKTLKTRSESLVSAGQTGLRQPSGSRSGSPRVGLAHTGTNYFVDYNIL